MLKITATAEQKIVALIGETGKPVQGLRVGATARSPFKVDYRLAFLGAEQVRDDDTRVPFNGFDVYLDAASVPLLQETTIDYVDEATGAGFKIDRAHKVPPELRGTLAERVLTVIEEQINPSVGGHGGHVTLMEVRDGIVYVELGGGCRGCGMAKVTLKQGIERMLLEALPEIKEVRDVTDHAGGENPYYAREAAE